MTTLNPALRTIRLYGEAGRRFGRVHHMALDTNSVAEAVQALCSQTAGLRAYLMGAKDRGIGFAVFAGKKNLARDELKHPVGDDDIRIAPIIMGNKRGGLLNIILGIVLVAVGVYFDQPQLIVEGAVMIVGGVVQMLSPLPKGLGSKDSPGNTPSYSFNGPINTEAQGHPVPYFAGGPMWIGSAVVSAGISVEDHSHAALAPISGSGSLGYGGDMFRARTAIQ